MAAAGCDDVARYLERFLDRPGRVSLDVESVSDHVGGCPSCYTRLSQFFRTVELPESDFLRETIDELALALYNLAKAVIRDRPAAGEDDETDNLRITQPGGGSAEENARAGSEMIDDAEDYTGASSVGGLDLEALRAELKDASRSKERRTDLALALFRRLTALQSRYGGKAWNWIGALHLRRNELDQAEQAFLKVLAAPDGGRNARAFAHCNLGYLHKTRGDLDRAIRAAQRSVAFAEEDDEDPYFGRFAEVYFRILRGGPGDEDAGRAVLATILGDPRTRAQFFSDLALPSNAPILEAWRNSALGREHSGT